MTAEIWSIIAVVVAIVVILLLLAQWPKGPAIVGFGKDDASFLEWLRAYEIWYTKSSDHTHNVLSLCRITPIVTGFAVALVSAIANDEIYILALPIPKNIAVIVLTGIATLCVSILGQLRIADLARVREIGRINSASLVARAQLFFSVDHSPTEALAEKTAIKDRIFELEHDQASLFAALGISSGGRRDDKGNHNQYPPPDGGAH